MENQTYNDRDFSKIGDLVHPPYFFGAYDKWQNIEDDAFSTEGWVDHCRELIQILNKSSKKLEFKKIIKKLLLMPNNPDYLELSIQAIKRYLKAKDAVEVLDVGGGFGDNYHYIKCALGADISRVNFAVVDNKVQCELGRDLYRENPCITFQEEIPNQHFDVTLLIGTLQYIKNWKLCLEKLCSLTSSLMISRTPLKKSGNTFVSIQSICPSLGSKKLKKIGEANVSIISENELDEIIALHNFRLKSSIKNVDYSSNFSRLPLNFNGDIFYIDKEYEKF